MVQLMQNSRVDAIVLCDTLDTYRRYLRHDTSTAKVTIYGGIS